MSPFASEDLKSIVCSAGEIAKKAFGDRNQYQVSEKLDRTLVTSVDHAVNEYLKKNLLDLYPNAAWISEEEAHLESRASHDWAWIVDPIDGTANFVAHKPGFALSVALAHKGHIKAGCVYSPISNHGGVAVDGGDLEFWGLESASPSQSLKNARISFSRREQRNGMLKSIEKDFCNIIFVGSVANKIMRVAAGAEDLYVTLESKSEWDVAAGLYLLKRAGKSWRCLDGQEIIFNSPSLKIPSGLVCGEKNLVDQFVKLYRNALALS